MINYKHSAFTLVELLVSMVISALLLTAVLGSFWVLMQTNQKNEISGRLQQQTNFALLRISDKIKNHSIDYEKAKNMTPLPLDLGTPQKQLLLNGNFEFKKTPDNLTMNGQPLFSNEFKVTETFFWVSPSKDPLDLTQFTTPLEQKKSQLQPKVTIVLQVESKRFPNISLDIQTTISSRKYQK